MGCVWYSRSPIGLVIGGDKGLNPSQLVKGTGGFVTNYCQLSTPGWRSEPVATFFSRRFSSLFFCKHCNTAMRGTPPRPCPFCHVESRKLLGHKGPCVVRSTENTRRRKNVRVLCVFLMCTRFFLYLHVCVFLCVRALFLLCCFCRFFSFWSCEGCVGSLIFIFLLHKFR